MVDLTFRDESHVELGDVAIRFSLFPGVDSEELVIGKTREMIEALIEHLDEARGGRILEIGIHRGGSTALVAKIAEPARLVALELSREPVQPLEEFIGEQGLGGSVQCLYGVDQGDRDRVASIVDEQFGEPLDLVLDDASHLYEPTRASFEVLFPRLRPGGLYLIEDWKWEHNVANTLATVWADPSAPVAAGPPPPEAIAVVNAVNQRLEPNDSDYTRHLHRLLLELGSEGAGSVPTESREPAGSASTDRAERRPLTTLALQLLLLRASTTDLVREIVVSRYWVAVRRGDEPVDGDTFSVSPELLDCFGQLG